MNDPDEPGVLRIPSDDRDNRATVALVSEKVDGLKDLIRAEFRDVQRQLDGMSALPGKVHALELRATKAEARIASIEQSDAMQQTAAEKKREYRAGTLPLIIVAVAGTLINAALYFAPH